MHLHANELVKHFDEFPAVDGVGLSLEKGQFLSLLGPSGCGKTTTLRMLAGFEMPDSGAIRLAESDITNVAAKNRNIGMVFQNYALFPHMSVADNVAFGLKMRGVGRVKAKQRVERALDLVQMGQYSRSRPAELSGGQQQRVALARALVIEPVLLLLDEPLSALDLKLREELREEISRITSELEITTVFVTHDQNEALVLSDKVAVMNKGRIEQLDTPENLYERPATPFVAQFLGGANVLEGDLVREAHGCGIRITPDLVFQLDKLPDCAVSGDRLTVSIRPEAIEPAANNGAVTATGTVCQRRFLGSVKEYDIALDECRSVTVRWPATTEAFVGEKVGMYIPPGAVVALTGRENNDCATAEVTL